MCVTGLATTVLEVTDELGDCDEYSEDVAEAALAKASLVANGHDSGDHPHEEADHPHAHIHWWLIVLIIILFLVVVVLIVCQVCAQLGIDDQEKEEGVEKTIMVGVANPVYSAAP